MYQETTSNSADYNMLARLRKQGGRYAKHMIKWLAWFDQLLIELPVPESIKVIYIVHRQPTMQRRRRIQDCSN